jgi:drug/metabolite transporter (DMT)-like permease
VTHLLALVGVLSISFSAVFVRLAAVSPVAATLLRAGYAIPLLALIWVLRRSEDRRSGREHLLAFASGLILAVDLNLWHASIAMVGAGLGTVIPNVQVVFVALAMWLLYGERLPAGRIATIALVGSGVVLASGLARTDAYGSNPVLGVVLGVLTGVSYAAYILVFKAATTSPSPAAGPLLGATAGVFAGALASIPFDAHFSLSMSAQSHGWLALLAIVCQVFGWMCITTALPRLPMIETSILLLGQPVFAVIWGVLLFGERLSMVQWAGCALVLGGVATLTSHASPPPPPPHDGRSRPRHSYSPAT